MEGLTYTNEPLFLKEPGKRGFQEVWYLKFNDILDSKALWLRFTVLILGDRSKEVAEVWAIFFDRKSAVTRKIGLKNTFPLDAFSSTSDFGIHIGENSLWSHGTSGMLHSEDCDISWNFEIADGEKGGYDFIPGSLRRLGLVKNRALTVFEKQFYSGWSEINGTRFDWKQAPGMQGHLSGEKNGHSWLWGHCNCFVDESGDPVPLIWDGLSARARIANVTLPPLTSMLFCMGDTSVAFDTVADQLRIRSSGGYDGWRFSASKSGYRFDGEINSQADDFAGVTYEDTDGSRLFCHNSKICDFLVDITEPGGKKRRYVSKGTTAYEVVSRSAHPEVKFLI